MAFLGERPEQMLTTDTLKLLHALAEGDPAALEPVCAGRVDEVRYPAAEDVFEGDAAAGLAALEERGVLESTFADRVLSCPACGCADLGYRQACAGCGEERIERRVLYEHEACGCIRAREAFEDEPDGRCPECGVAVARVADELVRMGEMYRCAACGDRSDEPVDRLRCRGCGAAHALREPVGHVLYRYEFDDDARGWLEWHLGVRERLVDLLETRGYRVRVDVPVDGGDRRVHVHAADPTFGLEVVVSIRDEPAPADVEAVAVAGEDLGAAPLLVAMAGHVTEAVEARAERHDVLVLPVGREATAGTLDALAATAASADGPGASDAPASGADEQSAPDGSAAVGGSAAVDESPAVDGSTAEDAPSESATPGHGRG